MTPTPYKTTAIWDEISLPTAIRGEHSTKAGVWGVLRVLEGEVDLVFAEPARRVRVNPSKPGLIGPQEVHHVELRGPMRMQVEFYDSDPSGGWTSEATG